MIGIIGASGGVGRHTAAALAASGVGPLRLGARRPEAITAEGPWPTGSETVAVDALDPGSLSRFCAGCRIVVNCAGPSYIIKDTVARAALAAGADTVDVLGDDPAYEALAASGVVGPDRTVVLSAGAVPGLSGLVPFWLAESGTTGSEPTRLRGFAGGLERITAALAADILLSLDTGGANGERFGQPLAAWRHGRRAARALRIEENAEVPFFPQRAALHPLLTPEVERLAARMGLAEADWYSVFPGEQIRGLFTTLPTLALDTAEQRDAVMARIRRAAEVDAAGSAPYYRLVFTMSGEGWARTGVVRTDNSFRLSGAVAAVAVGDLLAGRIGPGLHFAAAAMDPWSTIAELERTGAAEFAVHEHTSAQESPDTSSAVQDAADDAFEDGAL